MRAFHALLQRVDQGDLGSFAILVLIAAAAFVVEIGAFSVYIAWMESRREAHWRRQQKYPPADVISINAARHRRLLDLEGGL